MLIFAYIVPLIGCLLLRFAFHYHGEWTTYFWTLVCGEAIVGIVHWLFYWWRTSATEYLGAYVVRLHHKDAWTELVEKQETRRDADGNTYTVTRIEEKDHPEEYHYYTNLGAEHKTNSDFYRYVSRKWDVPTHRYTIEGKNIKYGRRHEQEKLFSEAEINSLLDYDRYATLSEENSYENKIRNSNSIFNFERISKADIEQFGLYEWPSLDEHNDSDAILSHTIPIPKELQAVYRRFNALVVCENQMRLLVLLFDADLGVAAAEKQKAYWKGGNKNEFIVCLGVNEEHNVNWVYSFSWAKECVVEVETNQWFLAHPELDLYHFLAWFSFEHKKWVRREFKDFKYIRVSLKLWQTIVVLVTSVLYTIFTLRFILK